jgi:hypothetical protein
MRADESEMDRRPWDRHQSGLAGLRKVGAAAMTLSALPVGARFTLPHSPTEYTITDQVPGRTIEAHLTWARYSHAWRGTDYTVLAGGTEVRPVSEPQTILP